ncbi:hypothetical protein LRS10_05120 [Phenylobacterium sp. J426]|uniref:hypothetical protein n=1 Tax=Phenylobacterium sp. J426 TaxID=2898439 RepID=UPI002150AC25|nr:hypothetical protein [Phenylobacterium sp. J426]MCR5873610.1 hypothetical protein [Phenylobacterium sp. J426]
MTILYPVAVNAEQALARPLGRAARESEARRRAGEAVAFTTDPAGPAFPTREAALAAYGDRLEPAEPADRFCQLVEQVVAEGGRAPQPVEPTYEDGRRWPAPAPPPRTAWRLIVSYWRVPTPERPLEAPQARQARKSKQALEPDTLRAIARAPLRPVKPQQPLDIGLFETRPPEAPTS